nr:MnhB domain-containing protein [sulfur-oxidizing endosymbiont of Gigantopelta aegis]
MITLSYVLLTQPEPVSELPRQIADNLENTGVKNPVTAVLLNYRAYDTFLEMAVLLLALIAVKSLADPLARKGAALFSPPGEVLTLLSQVFTPLFILIAGYLLWAGADKPGGAFQAGSVLAVACVLPLLTNWRGDEFFARLSTRLIQIAGLSLFLLIGLFTLSSGNYFLEFSPAMAGGLILIIEVAATLSIALSLGALFFAFQSSEKGANK